MIRHLIVALTLALTACGGSDTSGDTASNDSVSSDSTGSESPGSEGETCAGYSPGDACIDDSNFAQCQQMEAQCPGSVEVMESCPLQFACPDASPHGGDECLEHAEDEECMGAEAFAQCQEITAQCPGEEQVEESCPLQFSCP